MEEPTERTALLKEPRPSTSKSSPKKSRHRHRHHHDKKDKEKKKEKPSGYESIKTRRQQERIVIIPR